MNPDVVSQFLAAIMGGSACWMVGRPERWSRWGFLVGFLAQPFWIYTFVHNHQWPLVVMDAWYTYAYGQGVYFKIWRRS